MSTPQERLKIFQQEQQAAERRRIFEEEERRKVEPQPPQGEPEGILGSFQTGVARGALDYVVKPVVSLADAVGSAAGGDFQPISDLAERAGRGLLNTVSAFDPTGAAYAATEASQRERLQELQKRAAARTPETIRLIEKGQQVSEARPRTTAGKIAKGVGTLTAAAAPAVVTGIATGGSAPAIAATTAIQSAAEPETAAVNVALGVVPLPVGKLAAPILRRLRGGQKVAAPIVEEGIEREIVGQGIVDQGKKVYKVSAMDSPLEVVASTGGSPKQSLGAYADEALALESGNLVTPKEKQTVLETIAGAIKAGMLTRPVTHLRNVAGTGFFQLSEEAARLPAVVADLAMAARTGRRGVSGPSITASGRSAFQAATQGIDEAIQILKKGASAEDLQRLQLPKEFASGSLLLDKYVNGVFRTLSAEDKVFRTYALRRSLEDRARTTVLNEIKGGKTLRGKYQERVRELIDNPTPDIQAEALADAEVATFNNQNKISNYLGKVREDLKATAGGRWVNFLVDTVAPFTKTPTNILGRMLDYSPYGLTKGSYQVAKAIIKPAFTPEQQRQFALTFGRGAIGSAIVALGWKLQDAGLMTGLYEDESGKRNRDQAAGRPSGSLKIGDSWFQVTGVAPFGNLLAIGASLGREYEQERENPEEAAGKLAGILGNAAMEQPLLEGASNIMGTLKGDKSFSRTAGRLVSNAVPAIVGDVANAMDSSAREQEGFLGPIEARIPGVRNYLPVAMDALGRPLPNQGPLATFLDPTRSTRERSTPVLQEMLRLDVGLSKIKKTAGEPEDLYQQKVTRFGKLYQDFGNELITSSAYQRATDAQKRILFDALSDRVKAQVTEELKKGRFASDPRARLSTPYLIDSLRKREKKQ